MADRTLTVKIIGDSRSLQREFAKSSKAAATFQGTISGVSTGVGKLFAAGAAALGVRQVFRGLQDATQAASDLSEQINKSNVIFGKSAGEIKQWSGTTANSFGISQRAALEAAGAFGALFETAGLNERQAAQFSQSLVELAADMASFNNIDPTEALDKLRSGLAGEAEPLRRVGVLLSEARVKQEAYASGIAKAGAKLTEGQKVQARYNLILKDTARQQGDFGRTSSGLANQQRILAAQVENLQAKLGQALLPSVLALTSGLTKWLSQTENQQRVQRDFQAVVQAVGDTLKLVRDIIVTLSPAFRTATQAVGGLSNALKLLIAAFALAKLRGFTTGLGLAGKATQDLTRQMAVMEAAATLRFGRVGAAASRLATSLAILRTPITIVVALEFLRGGQELKTIRDGVKELIGDLKRGDIKKAFGGDATGNLRKFDDAFKEVQRTVDKLPKSAQASARKIVEAFRIDPTKSLKRNIEELNVALLSIQTPAARASASIEAVRASIEANLARTENFGAGRLTPPRATGGGGTTATQRNQWFDAAIGRRVDRVRDISTLQGQVRELRKIEALIAARIEVTKDITRKLNLEDDLLSVRREERSVLQAIRDQTAASRDRLKALAEQRAALAQERRERAAIARQARQFIALGLTAEGAERVPGVRALRHRLTTLRDQLKGTTLDTTKTRSQLARAAKVLSGAFGVVGRDVRSAIQQMFSDINDALKDGEKKTGTLTKFHKASANTLLAGIGLSPDQVRALRARLSQVGAGGTVHPGGFGAFGTALSIGGGTIVVNHTSTLDGQVIERSTTKHQQRRRRRNPPQKRGVINP